MGYDLHITRRENWFDDDTEISIEEWLTVVHNDPELRLDGFAEAETPTGEKIRIEDEGLCVWTAYSRHGVNGNMAWLWHSRGNVMAKNPDVEIRQKMWCIADKLGARIQGDEGEWYGPDGQMLPQVEQENGLPAPSRPWWRFW